MKWSLYLLVILFFAACDHSSKTNEAVVHDPASGIIKADTASANIYPLPDTALEQKIINALMKLPFVTRSSNYIDSFSNHRHGIAFMMDEPQENDPEISMRAGYNGGERFETYYRFFVNPETMEIKVYDPAEDKKITIKEYLKSQH